MTSLPTTPTNPDHSICQWIQIRIHYESESRFVKSNTALIMQPYSILLVHNIGLFNFWCIHSTLRLRLRCQQQQTAMAAILTVWPDVAESYRHWLAMVMYATEYACCTRGMDCKYAPRLTQVHLWCLFEGRGVVIGDCLEGKGKLSGLFCAILYATIVHSAMHTHMNRSNSYSWLGFCLTGPISLCLDSILSVYVHV